MIKKIDINSLAFQDELENTKEFTKDVLKKYDFVFNPDDEVKFVCTNGISKKYAYLWKKILPMFYGS